MSNIAEFAGVSRQTLYKEFGSRAEFAQAFVIHEGERFLDDVDAAVRQHLDDPRAAVGAALQNVPPRRRRGPARPHPAQRRRHRRHAALRHHPGHARRAVGDRPPDDDDRRGLAAGSAAKVRLLAESLVRLAISYITAPSDAPETTATKAGELLGPFIDDALGSVG